MDWANERWVKLYTRDTVTMRLMPWQARCLFWELLRKVDMSGWLELDGHGVAGLAVALGCDRADAERALSEWMSAGWVDAADPAGLLVPTHVEAQSTPQSNALRQRTKRSRRVLACRDGSTGVATDTDGVAHDTKSVATDTPRHAATPIDKRDKRDKLDPPVSPPAGDVLELSPHSAREGFDAVAGPTEPKPKRRSPKVPIPDDWKPTAEHAQRCREQGLDLNAEAFKFRSHAEANDVRHVRWGAAFSTWLVNAVQFRQERGGYTAAVKADEDVAERARRARERKWQTEQEAAERRAVAPPPLQQILGAIGTGGRVPAIGNGGT